MLFVQLEGSHFALDQVYNPGFAHSRERETIESKEMKDTNVDLRCQSCSMPIEIGPYCKHCLDKNGKLQEFSVRFEHMVEWVQKRRMGFDRSQAEQTTLEFMAAMPAWKENPELIARLAKSGKG